MQEPIQKYTPAHIPVIVSVWVLVVALLSACTTPAPVPEQYKAIDHLDTIAADIKRAAISVRQAVALGTLRTDSKAYDDIRNGLETARKMANAAKQALADGDPAAPGYAATALSVYRSIEPLLLRYKE